MKASISFHIKPTVTIIFLIQILAQETTQTLTRIHFEEISTTTSSFDASYSKEHKKFIAVVSPSKLNLYKEQTGALDSTITITGNSGTDLMQIKRISGTNKFLITEKSPNAFVVDLDNTTNIKKLTIMAGIALRSVTEMTAGGFYVFGDSGSKVYKWDLPSNQVKRSLNVYTTTNKPVHRTVKLGSSTNFLVVWRTGVSQGTVFQASDMTLTVPSFGTNFMNAVPPTFSTLYYYAIAGSTKMVQALKLADNTVYKETGLLGGTSTAIDEIEGLNSLIVMIRKKNKLMVLDGELSIRFQFDLTETYAHNSLNTVVASSFSPTFLVLTASELHKHNVYKMTEMCHPGCTAGSCEIRNHIGSTQCDQCPEGTYKFSGDCISACPTDRLVDETLNKCGECNQDSYEDNEKICKRCQTGQVLAKNQNKCLDCPSCCESQCGYDKDKSQLTCGQVKDGFVFENQACGAAPPPEPSPDPVPSPNPEPPASSTPNTSEPDPTPPIEPNPNPKPAPQNNKPNSQPNEDSPPKSKNNSPSPPNAPVTQTDLPLNLSLTREGPSDANNPYIQAKKLNQTKNQVFFLITTRKRVHQFTLKKQLSVIINSLNTSQYTSELNQKEPEKANPTDSQEFELIVTIHKESFQINIQLNISNCVEQAGHQPGLPRLHPQLQSEPSARKSTGNAPGGPRTGEKRNYHNAGFPGRPGVPQRQPRPIPPLNQRRSDPDLLPLPIPETSPGGLLLLRPA